LFLIREEEVEVSMASLARCGEEEKNDEMEFEDQERREKKKAKKKKKREMMEQAYSEPDSHVSSSVGENENPSTSFKEETEAISDLDCMERADEKGKKKKNKKNKKEKTVEADTTPPREEVAEDSGCEDADAKQKKKKKGKKEKNREKKTEEESKSDKENEQSPALEEERKRKRDDGGEASDPVDETGEALQPKKSKKSRKSEVEPSTSGMERVGLVAEVNSGVKQKKKKKSSRKEKSEVPASMSLGFNGANILAIAGYGEDLRIRRKKHA
jgi:hypothetical protein